jgi:small subunit ribosomal protein S8
MPATDPIADFLTRIRNAVKAKKKFVDIPSSKMKVNMAEILRSNKFIRDFNVVEDNKQNVLRIHLQYINGVSSIAGLKRISTPGLHTYVGKDEIPKV